MMDSLTTALATTGMLIGSYIPRLIAGFLILFIGVIIASLVKDIIRILWRYLHIDEWVQRLGGAKVGKQAVWEQIVTELVRWTTIIIFLMSAVDVWGIPKVADVIRQLLAFLPNVIVAVIIGWIGIMAARFAYNIVRHSAHGAGKRESFLLASVARYAILFFTVLIILTQLGIAADLVKILFTGIVAMLALSGGLAFGLGGQEEARDILRSLRRRISSSSEK